METFSQSNEQNPQPSFQQMHERFMSEGFDITLGEPAKDENEALQTLLIHLEQIYKKNTLDDKSTHDEKTIADGYREALNPIYKINSLLENQGHNENFYDAINSGGAEASTLNKAIITDREDYNSIKEAMGNFFLKELRKLYNPLFRSEVEEELMADGFFDIEALIDDGFSTEDINDIMSFSEQNLAYREMIARRVTQAFCYLSGRPASDSD